MNPHQCVKIMIVHTLTFQLPSKMCHPRCPQAGEEDFVADAPKNGKNQFNFSERAAQTFNNTLCTRGVATEPPPVVSMFHWFDFFILTVHYHEWQIDFSNELLDKLNLLNVIS